MIRVNHWEDQKLNNSVTFVSNKLHPEQEPKTLSSCKEIVANSTTGIGDNVLAILSEVLNHRTHLANHCVSTNLMSEKANDGVVNKRGQALQVKNLFVSDGSQFTSSGAENPILNNCDTGVCQTGYFH
jgi:choline dehydrogenase-like flavoprotein